MKKLTAVFLACLMLMSALFSVEASASSDKVFYLFGYINGRNYACEEDFENMGSYRFVNGELKVYFDTVSYVAVKEDNNACWYMTDGWQGDVNSVTLYNTELTKESSDKLKIPAGEDVILRLTDNGDGSLTLSYEGAEGSYPIRDKLSEYVHNLKNRVGDYWTPETEKPFYEALGEAEKVLENSDSTDDELRAAYKKLKSAEQNLKSQDRDYWVNKIINLCAAYSMDFENIDYMYTIYDKESFDNYYNAYRDAQAAVKNDELFWYDLSGAYYNLENAHKSLKKLDGTTNPAENNLFETEEFMTLLNAYVKTIGASVEDFGVPVKRTLQDGSVVIEYRGITVYENGSDRVVFALSDMLDTVGEEIIGGYKFQNPSFFGVKDNQSGLCVYVGKKIYSLKEAVEQGICTAEEMAEIIPYTEKYDGTLPVILTDPAKATAPTQTVPTLPTNSTEKERPTMPVVIGDGEYLVQEDNTTEPAETTAPAESVTETEKETSTASETVHETTAKPVESTEPAETTVPDEPLPAVLPTESEAVTDNTEPETETKTAAVEPESTAPDVTAPTEHVSETKASEKPITTAPAVKVKKANPIKITAAAKSVKAKKLKKGKITVKPFSIKKAEGKVKIVKAKSTGIYKKLKVNSRTGAITFKKGKYAKKTYRIKLKITASGNSDYKAETIIKTVKIKVK